MSILFVPVIYSQRSSEAAKARSKMLVSQCGFVSVKFRVIL